MMHDSRKRGMWVWRLGEYERGKKENEGASRAHML
jgi:hypothetical protein